MGLSANDTMLRRLDAVESAIRSNLVKRGRIGIWAELTMNRLYRKEGFEWRFYYCAEVVIDEQPRRKRFART